MIENFKNQIEIRRKERGLTIQDLESEAGLKRSSLHNFLIGRVQLPRLDTFIKLAQFFDCSIDELVFFDDEKKSFNAEVTNVSLFKESLDLCVETFEKEGYSMLPRSVFSTAMKLYRYSIDNNLNAPDKGYLYGFLQSRN